MEKNGMEWNGRELKGYIVFIYSVIIVRNIQLTIRYMYVPQLIEHHRIEERESKRERNIGKIKKQQTFKVLL